MVNNRIMLNEAVKFHGHLGPYLVLGILAGEFALKRLRCKKYFGLEVRVRGAGKKPKSCFIDGLQLSTGATYGKGNIKQLYGPVIKAGFCNRVNHKKITLKFKRLLIQKLKVVKTDKDSEALAKEIYKTACHKLFDLTPNT